MMTASPLQIARYDYEPKLPGLFRTQATALRAVESAFPEMGSGHQAVLSALPLTGKLPLVTFEAGESSPRRSISIGVVLSGGQAPGGHNMITGLYDALRVMAPGGNLYGFLGGPAGLISGKATLLTDAAINACRNTGGFDLIGSGRTKLETDAQFAKAAATCQELALNAVVIVGGDDSNTNASLFAEYCLVNRIGLQVIGCPKTIDGDLKNEWIETSFGFDTATKVYSELIGNILRDANSARKYWHFIKLMGRSASHIALECAFKPMPT